MSSEVVEAVEVEVVEVEVLVVEPLAVNLSKQVRCVQWKSKKVEKDNVESSRRKSRKRIQWRGRFG